MKTRHFQCLLCLILAAGLLAGCPRPTGLQFTSANGGGRGPLAPGLDGAEGEGEAEGEYDDGVADVPTREVVEPDVIRRAGDLLYVLNQHRGLSIVDLDSETLLTQVPTFGYPRDLYLSGGTAYVLVGFANHYAEASGIISLGLGTRLYVVDVADPGNAAVTATFELEGDLIDSRLVGDVLYTISADFQWDYDGIAFEDGVIRKQTSSSWVSSIHIADPQAISVVDTLSFAGYGSIVQATNFALFVAANDWQQDRSLITYVDISDPAGAIAVRGNVAVQGFVADRFKMDAFEGVLRVVSNTNWPRRDVYVTTVNLDDPDTLAILGQTTIPNAAGETLFATRFDGPMAYVVTYLMVDPLFVIDLSDPAAPVVAGELKVPGWSTHIEPRGDRLIALGVDDTGGRWQVKVSLFDVSDPTAPGELDAVSFGGDWSWSTAHHDVKAFTVLDDVLIVPFSGYSYAEGGFERLQFVSHTRDSLQLRGSLDLQGQILRSFRGGDFYYGVTTEQVAVINGDDLDAPALVNSITLAEYVSDYQVLESGVHAAILSQFEKNASTVRTLDAATGGALGEVSLDVASVIATAAVGNRMVLVCSTEDYDAYYRVIAVDCDNPAVPVIAYDVILAVRPYWGGYWYDGYDGGWTDGWEGDDEIRPGAAPSGAKDFAVWYPWWRPGNAAYFAGNTVALRCQANRYDSVFGEGTAGQGLAFVNLETGTWTATVGLAQDWIEDIGAAGDKLYLSTKQDVGFDMRGRPICAFYLQEIDPEAVTIGQAVNVPGAYLFYDPSTQILVLEDLQYENQFSMRRVLSSVQWNDAGSVRLLDTLRLPENAGSILARRGRIYYDSYGNNYRIHGARISANGQFESRGGIDVTGSWAYLLEARGDSAYVVLGANGIARYDFSRTPRLAHVEPVMSSPLLLRFGPRAAYAPLGYAGIAQLPL